MEEDKTKFFKVMFLLTVFKKISETIAFQWKPKQEAATRGVL